MSAKIYTLRAKQSEWGPVPSRHMLRMKWAPSWMWTVRMNSWSTLPRWERLSEGARYAWLSTPLLEPMPPRTRAADPTGYLYGLKRRGLPGWVSRRDRVHPGSPAQLNEHLASRASFSVKWAVPAEMLGLNAVALFAFSG